MKLLSSLLKTRQVKEAYKEITDADFVEINKRLITQGGVIKRGESGEIRVSTEGDSTLTQAGRKAPRKKVSEASALHDVEIDDMKEKPDAVSDGKRTADQLEIGDVVEISGNVQYKDQTGEITRFGKDKKFVVVKLYGIGEHSFHSSDVVEAEKEYEETDGEEEDEDQQKFYVAFYDEDEERSWIGLVTKEGGGKWHEKQYKGKPEYRWGQTYMSYLKPDDIMSWIHKDYRRGIDIEGPFYDAKEAEHHVTSNWGKLEEAVGGSTLKKAIAAALTAAKKDGTLNDATHGPKSGVRSSVIAMAKELSDVADDKKKFVAIYDKWNDSFGGITDLLADELFKQYGAETFKEFLAAAFKTPVKEAKKEIGSRKELDAAIKKASESFLDGEDDFMEMDTRALAKKLIAAKTRADFERLIKSRGTAMWHFLRQLYAQLPDIKERSQDAILNHYFAVSEESHVSEARQAKKEVKPVVLDAPDLAPSPDMLHAAIKKVGEKLLNAKYISEFEKPELKRMMNQFAATTRNLDQFTNIYNTWAAQSPDLSDIFIDDLFAELGVKNVEQLVKHHFVKEDAALDAMGVLDILASAHHGTMFRLLEASEAAQLVDFKKANEFAAPYGKARFWTLSQADMEALVNEHPEVLIGQAAYLLNEGKDKVQKRKIADVIHSVHNVLHHMAEEELVACKVYRVEVIGGEDKIATSGNVTVGFYADCNDKPRKKGLQKDLTDKLQERLNKHPFDGITVKCKVFHEEVDGKKLKEDAHDSWKDVESWKTAVKNAYPEKAAKLKFKAKIENGVRTISAEVSGEDRSYGVWDMDEKKGYVLESAEIKLTPFKVMLIFGIQEGDYAEYRISATDKESAITMAIERHRKHHSHHSAAMLRTNAKAEKDCK